MLSQSGLNYGPSLIGVIRDGLKFYAHLICLCDHISIGHFLARLRWLPCDGPLFLGILEPVTDRRICTSVRLYKRVISCLHKYFFNKCNNITSCHCQSWAFLQPCMPWIVMSYQILFCSSLQRYNSSPLALAYTSFRFERSKLISCLRWEYHSTSSKCACLRFTLTIWQRMWKKKTICIINNCVSSSIIYYRWSRILGLCIECAVQIRIHMCSEKIHI